MGYRRRYRQSARAYEGSGLLNNVQSTMARRRDAFCPYPHTVMETYNSMWTDKDREVIEYINQRPVFKAMMRADDDLRFTVKGNTRTICIDGIGRALPMPSPYGAQAETLVMYPDNPLYPTVTAWMKAWLKYEAESSETYNYVNTYLVNFNTWTQMCRAWPNLFTLFPGEARDKVSRNLNRARMPDSYWQDCTEDPDKRIVAVNFSPQTQHKYEQWLTEGLMVPEDTPRLARIAPA